MPRKNFESMNLENLFDSFEEKANDEMHAELPNVKGIDGLELLEQKYQHIKHPDIGFNLGAAWMNDYNYDLYAFPHFLNSVSFGLNPKNIWLNTGYTHTISTSIYVLIDRYNYNNPNHIVFNKLFSIAFVLWFRLYKLMGIDAYDSLKFMGLLFQSKNNLLNNFFDSYQLNGENFNPDIISITNFTKAAEGYLKKGEINNIHSMQKKVNQLENRISNQENLGNIKNLLTTELCRIGNHWQETLFHRVYKDFNSGKFSMDEDDFKQTMINLLYG